MADAGKDLSTKDPDTFKLGRKSSAAARVDRAARRQVEAWTRDLFSLGAADTVLVAEVSCGLPGCPPLETVIAFWIASGPRRQFKIFKPVREVAQDDLPPRWMKDALIVDPEAGFACC